MFGCLSIYCDSEFHNVENEVDLAHAISTWPHRAGQRVFAK